MVELKRFDTGPCRLFVKLESQNPGGSIKDRIARSMIEAAERDGRLEPGGTIVEATAGNTGLGLAQVGILKGYKRSWSSPTRWRAKRSSTCGPWASTCASPARTSARDIRSTTRTWPRRSPQQIPGAFYVNQFANPANPVAHETTTGPEIWSQLKNVDAVVVGVGSGGTLTGLGRFFAKVSPKTEMVLADPVGSILAPLVKTGEMEEAGSWMVEGIGEDFIPDNATCPWSTRPIRSPTAEHAAGATCCSREGILAGSSSGTLLAAALRYCREQTEPKRVVTFVCDTGSRYLSKVYNDSWLAEQGLSSASCTATCAT